MRYHEGVPEAERTQLGPEGRMLRFLAIGLAVFLAWLRIPLDLNHHVLFLTKALLHPASLSHDLLVQASLQAPYTFAPKALAYALAWLAAWGVRPEWAVCGLQALLWAAQAAFMFRLALVLSGSTEAAFLAVLLFGADMPLFLADAPYSIQWLERSLGMVPLLWGVGALAEGRRWAAWSGVGLATYLHANPAIYLWPWLFVEEIWSAWQDPRLRRGAALRMAAAAGLALPLVTLVGGTPFPPDDPEFVRMTIALHAPWIGGVGFSAADRVFALEGLVLFSMAAWRARELRALPLLVRAAAVCVALLVSGSVAYWAYAPGAPLLGVLVKLQPWIGLYLVELAGQLLLAAWLASEIQASPRPWPAFLLTLALSAQHDLALRLVGIGLGTCLLADSLQEQGAAARVWARRAAAGLTLLAALAPFAFHAAPELFWAGVRAVGRQGGLFSRPLFHPATGVALAACAVLGAWLPWRGGRSHAPTLALAALIVLGAAASRWRPAQNPGDQDLFRMGDWIREHAQPDAVLMASPLKLFGTKCFDFMARSERSVFACMHYLHGGMMYGEAGQPMAERLRALGLDLSRIRNEEGLEAELSRADRELDPGRVKRLVAAHGAGYLLSPTERVWPWERVHQEGGLALYRLRAAGAPGQE